MKAKTGFVLREICGEKIMVAEGKENIDYTNIVSMNETSAFLWENISGKEFTIDDLVKLILDNYENTPSPEELHSQMEELVKTWLEAKIVEP